MTKRFFNTAGPCKQDIHYILPPTGGGMGNLYWVALRIMRLRPISC